MRQHNHPVFTSWCYTTFCSFHKSRLSTILLPILLKMRFFLSLGPPAVCYPPRYRCYCRGRLFMCSIFCRRCRGVPLVIVGQPVMGPTVVISSSPCTTTTTTVYRCWVCWQIWFDAFNLCFFQILILLWWTNLMWSTLCNKNSNKKFQIIQIYKYNQQQVNVFFTWTSAQLACYCF